MYSYSADPVPLSSPERGAAAPPLGSPSRDERGGASGVGGSAALAPIGERAAAGAPHSPPPELRLHCLGTNPSLLRLGVAGPVPPPSPERGAPASPDPPSRGRRRPQSISIPLRRTSHRVQTCLRTVAWTE
ncbi:hypothetical protein E2562_021755 [Oryza meyeriana var. granulata]|uniref:Uncharacterized protein n=1 Tax=Oryza meyeriana var. granulata TaxID=110450 RepID=A0A6G1EXZ7_9ORYZ|nr:hypothetical protein E2562_021755 [Oryza meyeriana var. granulata]